MQCFSTDVIEMKEGPGVEREGKLEIMTAYALEINEHLYFFQSQIWAGL